MHIPLTLADFLYRAELVYGEREAVRDEPDSPLESLGSITYRELGAMARSLGAALDDLGVEEGARVAIVAPNSARFIISLFGVSAFGRVLVPVNFRLNTQEIAYILQHSGATVVLIDPELDLALQNVAIPHRLVLGPGTDAQLFQRVAARPRFQAGDEASLVSINYTSGTTGRPKGVLLSQRSTWLNAVTMGWHLGVTDRDVYLHTLPTFHCNGWGMPYALTAMGVRQIILRKIDGAEILRRVASEGVTLFCCAPTVLVGVLEAAAQARRVRAGSEAEERSMAAAGRGRVRVVVAGAPPPSKIIQRVQEELGWEFIQIYGLTETSPLLTVNRARDEWDGELPAARARLLSRAGAPAVGVRLRVSSGGEFLARSNHVFDGYHAQPEATAKVIADGWFHTGDGGHFEGPYAVISDRHKDVIITGGENVSSIEVEDCLYQHPAIAEAAVIAIPDEKWGESVLAFVVCRAPAQLTEAAVIDHCRELLAHFKCPRAVEFRDQLPRTATGKLQKFRLREPYWAGRDRQVS